MKLAIDIGFSSVKVTDGISFKFPTLISGYTKPSVDLGYGREKTFTYEGRDYLVGDEAKNGTDVMYSFEIDFLIDYAPLFIAKAVEIAESKGAGNILEIALGLPIEYYKDNKERLWQTAKSFIINDRQYRFYEKVKKDGSLLYPVYPQGIGILSDYIEQAGVTVKDDGSGFVLDIGFNTVLVVAFENYGATKAGHKQYTQLGISKASRKLEDYLINTYGIDDRTQIELLQILTNKTFKHYGKKIDVSDKVNAIMLDYIDGILLRVQTDYDRRFGSSDKLIIGGGGAYYVKNDIYKKYPDLAVFMENPEFSNARGFYHL
jgi:hypothetical protein